MAIEDYHGLLFIGDPHIEGRCPDFRCDDYPNVILEKLDWILNYAASHFLLPVFLGDVFDKPRNNPTWIISRLIEMMNGSQAIGIYGNHDCAQPKLTENDSLILLLKSNCIQLVSRDKPWRGIVNGRPTLIGGSSYRETIPDSVKISEFSRESLFPESTFGVWLSHHDVISKDYEKGRFSPFEIENIDLLVNGHIHTRSDPIERGQTLWMTPGNISRRSRSEKSRAQQPAVLKVTPNEKSFEYQYVTVPHKPFDEIFHDPAHENFAEDGASAFVAGLNELRLRKTSSGAGLKSFLRKNLEQFSDPVADEIKSLATKVTGEEI